MPESFVAEVMEIGSDAGSHLVEDVLDAVAPLVGEATDVHGETVRSAVDGSGGNCDITVTAAVNSAGWKRLPIADRDVKFAFRAATDRLAAHASSIEQFSGWFFWRDPTKPANNRNSYRMPFADVFDDGTVKLVPAAVFSAAAQLSGAHGALPIIPDAEKEQIRRTIDQIYDTFRNQWGDPRQVPPWERESNSVADEPVKASVGEENEVPIELVDDDELTAAVRTSGWSGMPTSTGAWDEGAARRALDAWAGDDIGKYGKAFLWSDGSGNKTGFKFPIARPVDGTLTIFIRAVNNADARLSQADIPAADKAKIQGILDRIQGRYHDNDGSVTAAATAPVKAPSAWYQDPSLPGPTKLRITDEGRVYGHLAQWNTCHRGIGNSCVLAPKSVYDYAHFKTGTTLTADGLLLPVGNLTYGAGHADTNLGYLAAAAHYDNAATTVANVNVGEDTHGIWVAGSMSPGTGELESQQLRAHPLSGDWRRTGGNLELIAALAVNTPGFQIAEPQYSVTASGEQLSLVAAGIVFEDSVVADVSDGGVDLGQAESRIASLEAKAKELQQRADRRRGRTIIDIKLPQRG